MNEHNAAWQRLSIGDLKWTEARLLLALSTMQDGETVNDAYERSGIVDLKRCVKAYKSLVKRGFVQSRDGHDCVTFYIQKQPARLTDERYTYPGATVTTKAVQ